MNMQDISENEPFDPARRKEILKVIKHSSSASLAALAFAKHDEQTSEKENKEESYTKAQKQKSEEFASDFEGRHQETLGNALAALLKVNHLTPAIRELVWKMDRENLTKLKFNLSTGRQGVSSGKMRYASLFAQVLDGLWLEAAPWGDKVIGPDEGHPTAITIKFYLTTDIHEPSSAVRLINIDQLGAVVGKIVDQRITS